MSVQRRDVPRQTEKAFLAQVIQAAHMLGWVTYHPFLSKWSQRGWPDLTLLRPPRLVLAELKADGGQPTIEQAAWLQALGQVPGIEVFLWHPPDLDAIVEVLR